MNWLRPLGQTGLQVSCLGLGTVKFGRNIGVKYPRDFQLPNDRTARSLLDQSWDLGINLLDTAPAYGSSESRLGELLRGDSREWLICTKVGEEFENGESRYDFSPEHCRRSVDRSLKRLGRERLDIVLVHSNGEDTAIIENYGTLQALSELKREGKIGAFGMSTKSVAGGIAAVPQCDALMLTYSLSHREDEAVMDACLDEGCGVLLKKVFASGHLTEDEADPVLATMRLVLTHAATGSAIIGTINPAHLEANVAAARQAMA
ncbi:MAG: aldo/keto reductase [Pseudomonadota bacterium]